MNSPELAGQDGSHDEKARQSTGHHRSRRSGDSETEHLGHGRDDRHQEGIAAATVTVTTAQTMPQKTMAVPLRSRERHKGTGTERVGDID